MSETWVINEDVDFGQDILYARINFTSNNWNFTEFDIAHFPSRWQISYDAVEVYSSNTGWLLEVYRTITFETAPTGNLLTWLQANAVKQEPPTPTLEPLRVGDKKIIGMYALNKFVIKQYIGEKLVYSKDAPIPKLSTPQNLSATGTVVEFDPVENAESYEVFADGVSIGEHILPRTYKVSGTYNNAEYACLYSLDNGQTWNKIGEDFAGPDSFVIENVTQIKFKATAHFGTSLTSEKLGLNLTKTNPESENFTLTQDIDDVESIGGGVD